MRTLFFTALCAAALTLPALAAAPLSDASFAKQAAMSDMYEIQASHMAQTKAASADIKTFASRMVTDHTKTSEQMKSLLASKPGMKPPAALDAKHKALLARLRSASGAGFDRVYAQQQLEAHQQAVLLFTNESQDGKDADLKTFASQTLPALQQHLSMAQQLPKAGGAP